MRIKRKTGLVALLLATMFTTLKGENSESVVLPSAQVFNPDAPCDITTDDADYGVNYAAPDSTLDIPDPVDYKPIAVVNSPAIDSFMRQFSVSAKPFDRLIESTTGRYIDPLTGVRLEYKSPKPQDEFDVQLLLQLLHDFETTEDTAKLNQLQAIINKLELEVRRIKEAPDILYIYPKNPARIGVCIGWRFGKMRIPGQPDTYVNAVNPLLLSIEHQGDASRGRGHDRTEHLAAAAMLDTGAKAVVLNAVDSFVGGIKKPDGSVFHPADAAHSGETFFPAVFRKLSKQLYPYSAMLSLHGKIDPKRWWLLHDNHSGATKGKSIVNLLGLAALDDIASGKMPDKKGTAVADRLPGFFRDGKIPVSGNTLVKAGIEFVVVNAIGANNRSIVGQIPPKGFAAHVETSPAPRERNSKESKWLIANIRQTMDWWVQYNDQIHNPWKQSEVNPDTYNNMYRYADIFTAPGTGGTPSPAPKGGVKQPIIFLIAAGCVIVAISACCTLRNCQQTRPQKRKIDRTHGKLTATQGSLSNPVLFTSSAKVGRQAPRKEKEQVVKDRSTSFAAAKSVFERTANRA